MANVKQIHRIKAISFDLDGILVDYRFVESVWFEGIPRLYSAKKRVSFDDAKKIACIRSTMVMLSMAAGGPSKVARKVPPTRCPLVP
jgi:hypothetical protein